jgi:hypothetical protein
MANHKLSIDTTQDPCEFALDSTLKVSIINNEFYIILHFMKRPPVYIVHNENYNSSVVAFYFSIVIHLK